MGLKKIDSSLCRTGCRICIEECPYDVLWINESTGKAEIRYPDDCNECYYFYFCAKKCPVAAIETSPEVAGRRWFAC